MVSAMNGFIAGTVFIWPAGENGGIQPPAVVGVRLGAGSLRPTRCEFAPHTRESLILPSRGANFLPGKAPGGCVGLRLTPGKALFFRRGAQTFCRGKAPAAMRVCASHPGKPYSIVERRKLFAGERRRRPWEFAPHSRESLILPSRGANLLPGKGAGGRGGLRLIPRKALFHRRGAQTFHLEKAPVAVRVCALEPGVCASFRESLILPLRGANQLPGRGAGGCASLRPIPGKALFHR